jgi:hypothetical protein
MKVKVRATPTRTIKGQPQQQPIKPRNSRVQRFFGLLRKDIDNFIHRKKDQGWEDYKRFCEMARGKR